MRKTLQYLTCIGLLLTSVAFAQEGGAEQDVADHYHENLDALIDWNFAREKALAIIKEQEACGGSCSKDQSNHIPLNDYLMMGRLKNGQWIAVYKTDIKGNSLVDEGINEPIIHQIMQKVVKPGDVTIDLGANYAMITLSLGQFVGPNGKVITFEASPPIAKVAALNAYINGLPAEVHNVALMDKNGPVHMRIDNRWSGKTMVATKETGVEVEGITLDDFLDRISGGNPPKIDFYRLDIQGCECVALAGSQKTIDNSPNIILTMEWEIRLLKHFSNSEQQLQCLKTLEEKGFIMWEVTKSAYNNSEALQADSKALRMIYPEQIMQRKVINVEWFASRHYQAFEGLFEKVNFKYSHFWSLSLDTVKDLIAKDYIRFNKGDFQGKQRQEKLVECSNSDIDCGVGSHVYQVLEALKAAGEKCSDSVVNHFRGKQGIKAYDLFEKFCQ